MSRVEILSERHFIEWGMDKAPSIHFGYAYRRESGELAAFGGLWFVDTPQMKAFAGRWWATLAVKAPVPRTIHKLAFKVLRMARNAGVGQVWASIDPDDERAVRFAERHGFERSGKIDGYGLPVWRLELNGGPRFNGNHGSGNSRHSLRPISV